MFKRAFVLAALLGASIPALAASLNLTVNVSGSTSVVCQGSLGGAITVMGPQAAGATICALLVSPGTWTGTFALSGANASLFAVTQSGSTNTLVVGSSPLPVGTYAVTVTATP